MCKSDETMKMYRFIMSTNDFTARINISSSFRLERSHIEKNIESRCFNHNSMGLFQESCEGKDLIVETTAEANSLTTKEGGGRIKYTKLLKCLTIPISRWKISFISNLKNIRQTQLMIFFLICCCLLSSFHLNEVVLWSLVPERSDRQIDRVYCLDRVQSSMRDL